MSDTDIEELFEFSVMVPQSKFRREFNQWHRWVEKHPKHSVVVTRNGVSIAVLRANSNVKEKHSLPKSFSKDALVVIKEIKQEDIIHEQLFQRITSADSRNAADNLFSVSNVDLNQSYKS